MTLSKHYKLTEAVGVPDNIEKVSEKITRSLLTQIKDKGDELINSDNTYRFGVKGPMAISDYKIKFVDVEMEFFESENHKDIVFASMGFLVDTSLNQTTLNQDLTKSDTVKLKIIYVIPKNGNTKFNELLSFIINNIFDFQSSISHELAHAYENSKIPSESSKSRAKYMGYTQTNLNLLPINKFIHYLYYTTATENVVRPSEVHSVMKKAGVERDKFVNFILSNEIYQKYKDISKFSLEEMISELKDYMPRIDDIMKEIGEGDIRRTDEEKIKRLLEVTYITLNNEIIQGYRRLLTSDFFENLFGFSGQKQIYLDNFFKEIKKYSNNPIGFFEYEIKKMNRVSSEMMKKISKVYSLIPDKEKPNKERVGF